VAGANLAHIEILSQLLPAETEENTKISQNIRQPVLILTKAILNLS
jgi:hypothetical protein